MTELIETRLQQLVSTIAAHNSVRAIGLSGGECPLPEAGQGDIDLFVYCTQIPAPDERQGMLELVRGIEQVKVAKLASGHWGQGDGFFLTGVETWLLYFTLDEAYAELEAILAGQYLGRLDEYYYPIGRCAMWKEMRTLHDPDGFLASLKPRLYDYPQELARALTQHHLAVLEDVEDLERAVQRRDVFFFHFALDLALDHFLQALFALNREYFPSRKRSETYLQSFRVKPEQCEERLRQIIALGGCADTLVQAYQIWKSLVGNLMALR